MSDEAARLAALAAGLCQDAGITIEVGPGGWAWDPVRRVIRVSEGALRARGPDYCAGVLTIEAGQYFLSRHHLFPLCVSDPPEFPSELAGRTLVDALEDARVNGWMAERYPGTVPWLFELARHVTLFDDRVPSFVRFCVECSSSMTRMPGPMPALPIDAIQALTRTREAREIYAALCPPTDFDDSEPSLFRRYRDEVRPALLTRRWVPPRWEQLVQLRAHEALKLARAEIFPAAAELLRNDLRSIERYLSGHPSHRAQARRVLEAGDVSGLVGDALEQEGSDRPASRWVEELAQEVFDAYLAAQRPRPLLQGDHASPGRLHPDEKLPPLPPLQVRPVARTDYDRAYGRVADQVERLTVHLGEILRPRRRLREQAGYPSGRHVHLKKLMAYEADPRRYGELWVRSTIPDRRNVAISLLVDLSGSMDGSKVESALLGTVLLAETLSRLSVLFAVNGFQDVLVPLSGFNSRLEDPARVAISEMPQEVAGSRTDGNNQPGYNDDGPCLREAAEELLDQQASDRMLVVVSDGLPEGRRSTANDLHRAVADLTAEDVPLDLLALGLGPHTEHVERFYPQSVANVPVERFSEEIGRLVEDILVGPS